MNLDVSGDPERSKLYMKNVVLTNVSGYLLYAVNCNIIAENCEFSNAKDALLYLVGGSHRFTHCTIVNYYPYHAQLGWVNSDNETLVLTDFVINWDSKNEYFPVISAEFFNTIFWSGKYASKSTIKIRKNQDNPIPYLFKNCLLPIDGKNDPNFTGCIFQVEDSLLFRKTNPNNIEKKTWYPSFDFRLQKDSPAKDAANLEIASQVPYDLNGFYRLRDGFPDLGAYEFEDEL